MVDPQVWHEIPDGKVRPAEICADPVQGGAGDHQAKIAEEDEGCLLGLEQWAGRAEVVDSAEEAVLLPFPTTLRLAFVVVVTGDIRHQIQGPSE